MIPGMNPRQMQKAMQRMGIQQQEIEATEVIIRTADKDLVITSPQVIKMNMMGQENFQISGQVHEREKEGVEVSEDDVKTVMDQANVSEEQARAALTKTKGDLAEAILDLSN